MTTNHPITPPPDLVEKWVDTLAWSKDQVVFTRAAQWGADQELEACCMWIRKEKSVLMAEQLDIARRPEPPTLKEQALEALEVEDDAMPLRSLERSERFDTIRRALEALPND